MSLAMTLLSLMSAWVAVALAMLWGVMRIVRRHAVPAEPSQPARRVYRPIRRPVHMIYAHG
ncbi:hypothetical protein [Pseudomonas cremoricolorata]|uniref:Uncharacterized protein n=1 Tax=Pseudomonas cremoricolorata TaxID=157783 RepID=A0A089WQB9_9PSED|nr:hypothetical protein [Pseudomonas cremoricolorata]AIR90776.1 hypothetical protein LK03_16545 [Pseudomonas cremoricolorata]